MNLETLRSKKVAVLGLSVEGTSVARFLTDHRITFTVLEKKERPQIDTELLNQIEGAGNQLSLGENHLEGLADFEVVFRSQGIPLWQPEIVAAKKKGVIFTSMTKVFFDVCPGRIIGVTGTKGKGTTATLIYEMLKDSGFDVFLGGNIGLSPLDFFEKLTKKSWVVLELSSFQLEDLEKSPQVAVVLMVTADHLDSQAPDSPNYHRHLSSYLTAKKNIIRFQTETDTAIINYDFGSSRSFAQVTKARVLFFSVKENLAEGAYLSGDQLMVCRSGTCQKIAQKSEVFLRGEHNLQNVLAATLAAFSVGAPLTSIQKVVKTFKGLTHRLEFVALINGVKYYNDSFSTTPETAMAAIRSFSEPEIIILGGSEKGSDYLELGQVIANAPNIKAVILIGATTLKIKEAILKASVPIGSDPKLGVTPKTGVTPKLGPQLVESLTSLGQVVEAAARLAVAGDVVVLSPACASFDWFKNYKERGEIFKAEVSKLKDKG